MINPSRVHTFEKSFNYGGNDMLKKLLAMLTGLKKDNSSKTTNDYEKEYGSYTAGYRH